jgi:hypothetical protein
VTPKLCTVKVVVLVFDVSVDGGVVIGAHVYTLMYC